MHYNPVCHKCYSSWSAYPWLQAHRKCYGEELPISLWMEDNGWWWCYLHLRVKPYLGWSQFPLQLCWWSCWCCHGVNCYYHLQQPPYPPQWSMSNASSSLIFTSIYILVVILTFLSMQLNQVMLLGHSDSYTRDKQMQVTIAYNHFGEGLIQRMPR